MDTKIFRLEDEDRIISGDMELKEGDLFNYAQRRESCLIRHKGVFVSSIENSYNVKICYFDLSNFLLLYSLDTPTPSKV